METFSGAGCMTREVENYDISVKEWGETKFAKAALHGEVTLATDYNIVN